MACDEHQKLRFPSKKPSLLLKDISVNPPGKLQNMAADRGFFSDEEDEDPYSSDHFRMYEFKVRRCTRSRSHDWTNCPFAHPGEKARRRDPRRFHYSGTVCPEFRLGRCGRGDACEFAHGVFECWLHPARYRTEACKDGKNCKRKVCFFAHSPKQLRILPVDCYQNCCSVERNSSKRNSNCCLFCHCGPNSSNSPTSTLLGMRHLSPPRSPPLSPAKPRSVGGFSLMPRFCAESRLSGIVSYKDAVNGLMSSLEAMNFCEYNNSSPAIALDASKSCAKNPEMPWIDIASLNVEDQQQSAISPLTSPGSGIFFGGEGSSRSFTDENKLNSDDDPDLGWVKDLLV